MSEPAGDPEGPLSSRAALLLKVWDDGEAEMIRQILLEYGIPSRVESDLVHALFPLSVDGLGEIRIYVQEERLEEAKEILAEHRRQGLEIVDGGDAGDAPRDPRGAGDPQGRKGEDRDR